MFVPVDIPFDYDSCVPIVMILLNAIVKRL